MEYVENRPRIKSMMIRERERESSYLKVKDTL